MSSYSCTWRYLRILSLHQQPTSLIILLSTPEKSSSMVPEAQRKRVDTSLDANPRLGLQKPTAVLRVFNIIARVIFFHLPARVITQASGVERGRSMGSRLNHPLEEVSNLFPPAYGLLGCEHQRGVVPDPDGIFISILTC